MKKIYFTFLILLVLDVSAQETPKFYLHENGVTCMCPNAAIGESGVVNGITYTKRTKKQIEPGNASTTCTSGITDMSYLFDGKKGFNGIFPHGM